MFINRLKVDKSVDKVADLLILNKIIKPSEEGFHAYKVLMQLKRSTLNHLAVVINSIISFVGLKLSNPHCLDD